MAPHDCGGCQLVVPLPASLLTDKAARSWNPTLHTGQKGLNRKSKMQRIIPGEMWLTGSANKIEMDLNLK